MPKTDSPNPVTWSLQDGGVAVLTIDRPDRLNALNLQVKQLIERVLSELINDPGVRVIVLTGANGVFVAGTDISEMVDMSPTDHEVLATSRVFQVLRNCPKPLIAAVERYALGGGMELALACDLIIAGEGARFAQPEIKVGIMPGAGGTQLLLRTVGKYRAMKLILTGQQITAGEAFEMGLLSEVVESGRALESAVAIATTIAAMPPLAVAAIKDVVRQGQDMPLTSALLLERKAFQLLFDSKDQAEGMQAFLDKRSPTFTGR
jgi:enoyl-CoA hydratase/carnithine racemase